LTGLQDSCAAFPDKPKGDGNCSMAGLGLSALSPSFMRSESFPSYRSSLAPERKLPLDIVPAANDVLVFGDDPARLPQPAHAFRWAKPIDRNAIEFALAECRFASCNVTAPGNA